MNKNHNNLGTIVVTPGARNTMVKQGIQPAAVLQQHIFDGWPNGFGPPPLEDGFYVSRIMSAQKMPLGELWVITEFDSQITTITLPDEA